MTNLDGNNNYIRTMKKYILPFMSIAMLMAMASCSSSDDAVTENNTEGKLIQITFTATQESNADTRTALGTENSVIWKTGDKIGVFDGEYDTKYNHLFTLSSAEGSTSCSFTGEVYQTNKNHYAVYPFTEGAYFEEEDLVVGCPGVCNITLPSTQTAHKDSFDPNAALMIAYSLDNNTFNFLNVVSLVKVTTYFACKRIVLNANKDIAGTGKLYYSDTNPFINFTSNTSKSIVLKPQDGQDEIAAGTYYIAVNPVTLSSGWSISFTSTDYNVYTRKANSGVTFNRGKIRSIGTFKTDGTWTHTSRGDKVTAEKEVDLGLTITKEDGKKYRVIFAKSNLKGNNLAANEYDYGDYFAWGATEPWCTAYTRTVEDGEVTVTATAWENSKAYDTYSWTTVPFSDGENNQCNEYTSEGEVLDMEYDAANVILGGEWQLPTKDIWMKLYDIEKYKWEWTTKDGYNGYQVTSKTNNTKTIFLPAAGRVEGKVFSGVGSYSVYWSGSALSKTSAYGLSFSFDDAVTNAQDSRNRYYGYPVRPVRLVADTE